MLLGRLAFDEDRVPDLTSEEYLQDVHSISSLLKMYFRELPNPLLTYQLYDKFAVSWLCVVSGWTGTIVQRDAVEVPRLGSYLCPLAR